MNEQNRFRNLWVAVICLFTLNIATLGWVFLGNRNNNRPVGPVNVEKLLRFEKQQIMAFEPLKNKHFDVVLPIREAIANEKDSLIELVKLDKTKSVVFENHLSELGKKIVENERNTLLHFKEIRDLCSPEQKKVFDEQFLVIVRNQSRQKRQGGPPPSE